MQTVKPMGATERICAVLRPILMEGQRVEPGSRLRLPLALAAELVAANRAAYVPDVVLAAEQAQAEAEAKAAAEAAAAQAEAEAKADATETRRRAPAPPKGAASA